LQLRHNQDKRKGVRFADSLDFSLPHTADVPFMDRKTKHDSEAPPMKFDSIREHIAEPATRPPSTTTTHRVSRFKAQRSHNASQYASPPVMAHPVTLVVPSELKLPKERIIVDKLVERNTSIGLDVLPNPPHELDAGIIKQEVAVEYHKARIQIAQHYGGFPVTDGIADSDGSLHEQKADGTVKRVSRFKAQRNRELD
jgi:unconventional prefoldin RPB5 interactor 1